MPAFKISLCVVITAVILYFGYQNHEEIYHELRKIDFVFFAKISFAIFAFILLQGFALFQVMKFWGIYLGLLEWIGITVVTFMANFLFPFLGFGFRAIYLRNRYGFPLAEYGKSLVILFAFELMVFGGSGLVAALAADFPQSFQPVLWLGLVAMMAGLLLSFVIKASALGPLRKLAPGILGPWQAFWAQKSLAIGLLCIMAAQYASFVVAHHYTFAGLDIATSPETPFVAASLVNFSFLLRLAPANLGGYEGALMLAALPEGLGFAEAAAIASILRLGMLVVLLPLTPVFLPGILKYGKAEPKL